MKNIKFGIIVATLSGAVYASSSNNVFQAMDNQIGVGIGYDAINAYNPDYSGSQQNTQNAFVDLYLEQLFSNNVWLSLDSQFVAKVLQSPAGSFSQTINQFGFPATLNGKVGYSFNWPSIGLQVIPYGELGHELNYNGQTLVQNGFANSVYNDFGLGARVEYVFAPGASVYFDQSMTYLSDPSNAPINLSAMSYLSALGIRYNVSSDLQISLQGTFNQINTTNDIGYDYNNLLYQNTMQSGYGAMFMLSYLFDGDKAVAGITDEDSDYGQFQKFDNDYTIGMGLAYATNSYSGNNLPNINSDISYYTVGFTHLFDNGVWSNFNGQVINSITQTNTVSSISAATTPTLSGFPGNLLANVGYAFPANSYGLQLIPYGDIGAVANINSYNIKSNGSLATAISQDRYYQAGVGARLELDLGDYFQLYGDELVALMDDQSGLNSNAWSSTAKLGGKFNFLQNLQINLDGFYQTFNPTGSVATNYALYQSQYGLELGLGIRY